MSRPVIAIVTGFTKSPALCEKSFVPLRILKRRGIVQRILYVTWDSPEIDAFVAPVGGMDDVEMVRLPQPRVDGEPYQKGVIYQVRNLREAIRLVPEDDALILKLRPDMIVDEDFIADKILGFDDLCAPSEAASRLGITMPPSPFKARIWIPWADSNVPFFYEDAAFLGLKQDVAKLASIKAEKYLAVLADKSCGWFAHVVRFAVPFLPAYPMFERYLREFRYMHNDLDYRYHFMCEIGKDAFFWHLLIANAWILETSFHVDCGYQGEIALYTNIYNPDADWSKPETLLVNPPYDCIKRWRDDLKIGGVFPGAARAYARLMDNDWHQALFSDAGPSDLSRDNLVGVLNNIAQFRQGMLAETEDAYYRFLADFERRRWQKKAA